MSHIHLLWDVPKFWWHAWALVVWGLLELWGLAAVALSLVTVVVRYVELRVKKKSHKEAMHESRIYSRDVFRTPLLAFVALFALSGIAVGPYELFQQDEQRVVKYDSLTNQVKYLKKQNDGLAQQVNWLTPKPEPANSLRRRTIRLADEVEKYITGRGQNQPPFAVPDSSDPNPSVERQRAILQYRNYQQETSDYYSHHFKQQMIGIIREYDAKGVQTGWLEKFAEQRPPVIALGPMLGTNSDDLYQFRELAYHVDANDQLIVF